MPIEPSHAAIFLIQNINGEKKFEKMKQYPKVRNPELIGKYPELVKAGGGYVWDDVLEFRVWCHPHDGAPDIESGNDYYFAYETYEEALKFSQLNQGCEEPL